MKRAWIRKTILLAGVATLLGSCAMYRLEELRRVTPAGTPFQNALARLYMDFAAVEEKNYDWFDSWYFADKGLRSAYGKVVEPEHPQDWNLPAEVLPAIEKARDALMIVLTPENLQTHAELAAQAQFNFDCWVEQQEENWQDEDIARCRDTLVDALERLHAPKVDVSAGARPVDYKKIGGPEPMMPQEMAMTAPALAEHAMDTVSYAVFFDTGKATLAEGGEGVIEEIASSLKDSSGYAIAISDQSENGKKSAELFKERAALVKQKLAAGGIKDHAILTFGRGQPSKEAARPFTRLVEIYIND